MNVWCTSLLKLNNGDTRYCLSQYFLMFTYEEKYTAYRHYFERQQSDLEEITLSLLKLIGLALAYLLVFDVTLIYFAE